MLLAWTTLKATRCGRVSDGGSFLMDRRMIWLLPVGCFCQSEDASVLMLLLCIALQALSGPVASCATRMCPWRTTAETDVGGLVMENQSNDLASGGGGRSVNLARHHLATRTHHLDLDVERRRDANGKSVIPPNGLTEGAPWIPTDC